MLGIYNRLVRYINTSQIQSPKADAIQGGGSSRIFLFRGLQKPGRFSGRGGGVVPGIFR